MTIYILSYSYSRVKIRMNRMIRMSFIAKLVYTHKEFVLATGASSAEKNGISHDI